MASVGSFEAGGFLQGLVSSGQGGNEMILLEKQGLCSQQQRQTEARCGSLPPSSLPRPKRHHKSTGSSKERRLGEYGRLSDGEGSNNSRKASANSSADAADKSRSSPSRPVIPLPSRKLGEYGRLSDGDRKTSSNNSNEDVTVSDKSRESPIRSIPLPPRKLGEYGRLSSDSGRKTPTDLGSVSTSDNLSLNTRNSPVRKFSEYGRYDVPTKPTENKAILDFNGRKISTEKLVESPSRSFIPPPRKLSDYGCFESPPPSPQSKESKLRLINPSTLRARRGSLSQPAVPKPSPETGVRSLPTPNKYRIQF